jgi:hypothetical protein
MPKRLTHGSVRGIANALSYALTQVRPDPSDERVSQKKRTEQMIQWETDLFAVSMALQLATGYDDTAFRRKCQGPKDRGENP